jgi:putative flippase GtrA
VRFARATATSIFTTSLDFALLALLVECFGVNYALATFLGTVLGASSNFLINRVWAFRAAEGHAGHQAARYFLVQLGSSAIHTTGVWLATRAGIEYLVAKFAVACLAYLVWNYPLNHAFVFRTHVPSAIVQSTDAVSAGRSDRTLRS